MFNQSEGLKRCEACTSTYRRIEELIEEDLWPHIKRMSANDFGSTRVSQFSLREYVQGWMREICHEDDGQRAWKSAYLQTHRIYRDAFIMFLFDEVNVESREDLLALDRGVRQIIGVHTYMNVLTQEAKGETWYDDKNSFMHDVTNILTALSGTITYGISCEDDDELHEIIQELNALNPSTIISLAMMVRTLNRTKAIQSGVRIDVNSDNDSEAVSVGKMSQMDLFRVLNEIVLNARKYSDPNKRDRWVNIKSGVSGANVNISVRDNGLGIPSIPRAMERGVRFYRSAEEGEGLGLSGVCDIVEANEWELSARSTLGVGSEFILSLPMIVAGSSVLV